MTIQQLLKVLRLVELVLCLIHRLHGQLITMLWKMGNIIGNLRLKEVHQVMVQSLLAVLVNNSLLIHMKKGSIFLCSPSFL